MAESNIVQKVRESALYVTENATDVKINHDVMNQFVDNMEMEKFINLQPPFSLPLRFDTLEEEVNLISLIDLINFASGWRKELHACLDRGAYESITYGCLGMHISGKRLTADFLSSLSISEIADFFGIPIHKESELQPGISTFVEHELRPLAILLQKVLNDTGNILKAKGFASLGLFVLDLVSKSSSAITFVEKLVETFPAFGDKANYKGKEVFIIKKAQLLAGDLYRNFKSRDKKFDFVDISQLTIFTDNVVPAVLRKLGILELSNELADIVDNARELPVGDREVELRLIAVRACQEIVEKAKEKHAGYKDIKEFNEMMLDYYLWLKGKEPEFRKVERHYTKATVFY